MSISSIKILINKHVVSRTIADLFGALSFTSAMVLIPMSLLASILQATPLFVTLGAAILLGEKVGWRRWSAILIGFLGVLIILQPGYGSFQPIDNTNTKIGRMKKSKN